MFSRIFEIGPSSPSRLREGLGVGSQPARAASLPRLRSAHPRPLPQAGGEKPAVGSVTLLLLLLTACHPADDGKVEGSEAIDCRLPGASNFEMVCTVDKMPGPDGLVLTARAPDGGFHRLLVVKDGRGVVAADGAEQVMVRPSGEFTIDVTAGDIVYRLPAKIAP